MRLSSGPDRSAELFRAIGHEVRQRMLVLLEEGERSVSELVAEFDLAQPTVSRHLAVLRQAGLVTGHRAGQRVVYSLNDEGLRGCLEFFTSFRCCPRAAAWLGKTGPMSGDSSDRPASPPEGD